MNDVNAIPLANQANAAWSLAWAIRQNDPQWLREIDKRRVLDCYRKAYNPKIRRLATDLLGRAKTRGRRHDGL